MLTASLLASDIMAGLGWEGDDYGYKLTVIADHIVRLARLEQLVEEHILFGGVSVRVALSMAPHVLDEPGHECSHESRVFVQLGIRA
jgi:hypothetical protein